MTISTETDKLTFQWQSHDPDRLDDFQNVLGHVLPSIARCISTAQNIKQQSL